MVLLSHRGANLPSLYFLSINFQRGSSRKHFDLEACAPSHGLIPVENVHLFPEGAKAVRVLLDTT